MRSPDTQGRVQLWVCRSRSYRSLYRRARLVVISVLPIYSCNVRMHATSTRTVCEQCRSKNSHGRMPCDVTVNSVHHVCRTNGERPEQYSMEIPISQSERATYVSTAASYHTLYQSYPSLCTRNVNQCARCDAGALTRSELQPLRKFALALVFLGEYVRS